MIYGKKKARMSDASKRKAKEGLHGLHDLLLQMDGPQTRRLYDLAFSAIHPIYLSKVIEEYPLTLRESEIYAQICKGGVIVATIVKEMAKARLKGLGEWKK